MKFSDTLKLALVYLFYKFRRKDFERSVAEFKRRNAKKNFVKVSDSVN